MSTNLQTLHAQQFEGFFSRELAEADPEIFAGIAHEIERERYQIELIASENIVSKAVLQALGSVFTNKYAEGYPGKRYYQGCAPSDEVETLAIERAKALFNCGYANVQPHSGAQANGAVMLALTKPGDTILGMSLDAGGHLTHGAKAAMSGKWFNAVQYGVKPDDHLIDFDQVRDLARQHRPRLIIAGGSAYPRTIDFATFRAIADEVDALFMVDMAHFAGIVAGGLHPSPFKHAHVVTTTTHKTLRGPRGGAIFTNHEDIAKKINSAVFPGLQGGPLMHVIAAKAVAFGEALRPDYRSYIAAVVENAKALAGRLKERGADLVAGGTDTHLALVDLRPLGVTGRDHLQQERHPIRPAAARQDQRHSRRFAGGYHPRLRPGRVPRHRRHDRRRTRGPAGERRAWRSRGRSRRPPARPHPLRALPYLSGALSDDRRSEEAADRRCDRCRSRHPRALCRPDHRRPGRRGHRPLPQHQATGLICAAPIADMKTAR
jgi:glycine hydroxymethyltransferase